MSQPTAPVLLLISGASCTGKTTIGRQLAADLRLPFLSRDDIKELLFDSLGWSDREWSRKLGTASWELLYYFLEMELGTGRSLMVESNFRPESAAARLKALHKRHSYTLIQILCTTEHDVLLRRFAARAASGERQSGHLEHEQAEDMRSALQGGVYGPLPLPGKLLEVDTTDLSSVNMTDLLQVIVASLRERGDERRNETAVGHRL